MLAATLLFKFVDDFSTWLLNADSKVGQTILLSTGLGELADMSPGTIKGLHLVVNDIEQSRAELIDRGVEMADIVDVGGGVRYAWFADPDGNSLTLQEMAWRTGDAF